MEDFVKHCIILVEVPTRVSETRIETFLNKSDGLEDFSFIGQNNAWFASYDDTDNAQAAITKLQGLKLGSLKIEIKPCTEQICVNQKLKPRLKRKLKQRKRLKSWITWLKFYASQIALLSQNGVQILTQIGLVMTMHQHLRRQSWHACLE